MRGSANKQRPPSSGSADRRGRAGAALYFNRMSSPSLLPPGSLPPTLCRKRCHNGLLGAADTMYVEYGYGGDALLFMSPLPSTYWRLSVHIALAIHIMAPIGACPPCHPHSGASSTTGQGVQTSFLIEQHQWLAPRGWCRRRLVDILRRVRAQSDIELCSPPWHHCPRKTQLQRHRRGNRYAGGRKGNVRVALSVRWYQGW